MQRIRLVSVDGETIHTPCKLSMQPGKGSIIVYVYFNNPKLKPSHYKFHNNDYREIKCPLKNESQIKDNTLLIKEISELINQYVRNSYDRDIIIYDLLKNHCELKTINISDSEFLLAGDIALTKGSYVENIDDDDNFEFADPSTLNLNVVRTGNKKKNVFYEKRFGPIILPDDWDVQPAGNSAITRRIKKNGPVWTVANFKLIKSTGKFVPKVIEYAAPLENIFEAKKYFVKNKKRLQRERVYRKIDKLPEYNGNIESENDRIFLKSFFKSVQDKT